jgi:hypothetical protein
MRFGQPGMLSVDVTALPSTRTGHQQSLAHHRIGPRLTLPSTRNAGADRSIRQCVSMHVVEARPAGRDRPTNDLDALRHAAGTTTTRYGEHHGPVTTGLSASRIRAADVLSTEPALQPHSPTPEEFCVSVR